ncbi:oxidoreductase [Geodermatophilus marinus]|uniref:oxidoreductase n=1 Tax=Geodermatophilus sp. LHW52908 TaxID=2303986 RepID=UPI000E3C4D23|nr:oxidoreductase [Geodermatophilus sp. LHW52908]RFU19825.1 SDR family NAD(P)-dependent oxidoreductase [Geodermatophilus sp. LHW52908]
MSTWSTADIPEQAGRTAVVTGGSSGLGLAVARTLAAAGARVVLAVRDETRGRAAADGLPGQVEVRHLDLADLASVRAFATDWTGDLDLLVNNAGIMMVPRGRTADGFELQFGTNHLGHFALTTLLLPHVTDRVVTVSSGAHRAGSIVLDDLNWERRRYSPERAYGQSKLANLLFTLELQRRLTAAGSRVRATAAHPGWAATNLQSRTGNRAKDVAMAVGNRLVATGPEDGALPILFAATADVPGGSYAGPSGLFEMRGATALVGRTPAASDPGLARRLWDASVELTGVDLAASLAPAAR